MNHLSLCKVCGANLFPFYPWGMDGKSPTYDICPCCNTEFGYEDSSDAGILNARKAWIDSGMLWLDPSTKPNNWRALEQIETLQNSVKKR